MTDHTNSEPGRIDALMTIEEVADMLRMPVATHRYWSASARDRVDSLSAAGRAMFARTSSIGPPGSVSTPDAAPPEFSTAGVVAPCAVAEWVIEPVHEGATSPKQRRNQ